MKVFQLKLEIFQSIPRFSGMKIKIKNTRFLKRVKNLSAPVNPGEFSAMNLNSIRLHKGKYEKR